MAVNPIEAEQICRSAESALRRGSLNLHQFPGLLKRVIDERLWERRRVPGLGIVELSSLRDLITAEPLRGWGQDPDKIEAVIRDDPEALASFRKEMTPRPGKRAKADIPNNVSNNRHGNSRAYTLDRLKRNAPALYKRVVAGELSANAAAIEAGFRQQPSPLTQLRAVWRKASPDDRSTFLREIQVTR